MSIFSGSLIGKRKADLVEIAEALGVEEAPSKNMVTLREDIQNRLDTDAERYRVDPQFEGLYRRTRRTHDSPVPEKTPRTRRSLAKAGDHTSEAAKVVPAGSPVSPSKALRSVANDTTEAVREVADNALALVDTDTRTIVTRIRKSADKVARTLGPALQSTEGHWRNARDVLSQPNNLLIAAIALEAAALYYRVAPFHHVTLTFPPQDAAPGSFSSSFGKAFSWMPKLAWTVAIPRYSHFSHRSDVWRAFTWWLGGTVAPPLMLSTLVSFVPQKGVSPRRGVTTRYQTANSPKPTVDALTFAMFRFAILLSVLYDAAPFKLTSALSLYGNATLRALGAGLLVALMFAQRITAA
ncbi:hypothetical protein CspeluHIS016_0900270 [Cutaneotrichosporon spelunceum]|uniref:Uncharacterized protein n=1 Tax=Cutaneotrichosporon spelunceum TaxID=1672016 RepID=A0AAD3YE19_9TREE|nr:hypothetical protein CspeluHIS016_0900270 [Cutaneotrichosporon spelunceum]